MFATLVTGLGQKRTLKLSLAHYGEHARIISLFVLFQLFPSAAACIALQCDRSYHWSHPKRDELS